jgi:bacitracin transport system ATP-binding protein
LALNDLIVETRGLSKKYGDSFVVSDVNLRVERGKIYGLLGRNGAGKTTLMKMILSLTPVTSGEIFLFGQPLKGNQKEVYPRIGALIETPGFYPNLTGTENLQLFARLRGMTRKDGVRHALDRVGLPYGDRKLFSEYSLGMKQRLGIANAILHEPEILILDEPTNGLDPIGIAEMRRFLKDLCAEKKITLLISSHILTEIEQLVDSIGILHNGILLEEIDYKTLQQRNRKYLLLKVSSASKAARLLEQNLAIVEYEIEDDTTVRVYALDVETALINRVLITHDVEVGSSHVCNDTLEDYFKKITGGVGIA